MKVSVQMVIVTLKGYNRTEGKALSLRIRSSGFESKVCLDL